MHDRENNISTNMRIFGFKCNTFLGVIETVFGHQRPGPKENKISLNIWWKEIVTSSDFQGFPDRERSEKMKTMKNLRMILEQLLAKMSSAKEPF